jgi:hypothetical protein
VVKLLDATDRLASLPVLQEGSALFNEVETLLHLDNGDIVAELLQGVWLAVGVDLSSFGEVYQNYAEQLFYLVLACLGVSADIVVALEIHYVC